MRASRNGPSISHLAFAGDLILFCEASEDQAEVMQRCLNLFCDASGSRVSVDKSRISFSSNTDSETRMKVCDKLGIYGRLGHVSWSSND